jgi:hypothetical protein
LPSPSKVRLDKIAISDANEPDNSRDDNCLRGGMRKDRIRFVQSHNIAVVVAIYIRRR